MAIFSTKKEETAEKTATKEVKTKKQEAKKPKLATKNVKIAYKVLLAPWVTEKSYAMMAQNRYAFKVAKNSTKKQVRVAVEGVYGVKIEKVAMINTHAKAKYRGRHMSQQPGIRKALVTLKEGSRIELFSV